MVRPVDPRKELLYCMLHTNDRGQLTQCWFEDRRDAFLQARGVVEEEGGTAYVLRALAVTTRDRTDEEADG